VVVVGASTAFSSKVNADNDAVAAATSNAISPLDADSFSVSSAELHWCGPVQTLYDGAQSTAAAATISTQFASATAGGAYSQRKASP
jgi:hypothetical protein